MQSRKTKRDLLHLSPVPKGGDPASTQSRTYTEIDRIELPGQRFRTALYALTVAFVILIIWSAFTSIDVVAVAPAQTVPRSKVRLIQPDVDGVLDSIFVQEGQRVTAGQKLASLDLTPFEAQLNNARRALDISKSDFEQATLAVDGLRSIIKEPALLPTSITDVGGVGKVISDVHATYIALQEAAMDRSITEDSFGNSSELAALDEEATHLTKQRVAKETILAKRKQQKTHAITQKRLEIDNLQKSLGSAKAELEHLTTVLESTEQQAKAFKDVFEQGAISRVDYLERIKEVARAKREKIQQDATISDLEKRTEIAQASLKELMAQTDANVEEQKAQIGDTSAALSRLKAQIRANARRHKLSKTAFESAVSTAQASLTRALSDKDQKEKVVSQTESALKVAERNHQLAQISSPVSGTITNIKARGHGQVVTRTDTLLSIVPDGSEFILEAKLPTKDAGFVERGQPARIKFAAYPFEDFGTIKGTVTEIEANSESDPELGLIYRVRITPSQQSVMARGRQRPLLSGMEATCEIITRKRTVLQILLDPIKRMSETRWQ